MVTIRDDMHYVSELDLKAIENDIAELGIHSLRITGCLNDEEKQRNYKLFDTLNREQWNKLCEENRKTLAAKVEYLVDKINENFLVYQYKNESISYRNDKWDLFFWCNCGDMSYVTLNTNEKCSNQEQKQVIADVISLIKETEIEGVEIVIQYTCIYNENKVKEIALNYCEKMQGKFIQYGMDTGKIVRWNDGFYFKKKNAKKYGYVIDNYRILHNVLIG